MPLVIVAGALASKPYNGGEAWVRLSWVLGLARLGVDVWFIEEAPSASARECEWFDAVVRRFGLSERSVLITAGLDRSHLYDVAAAADLLINISGNLLDKRLLALPKQRAYIDLDPAYTQFWHCSGALGDVLSRHEHHFTVGLALGTGGCRIPRCDIRWHRTPPPVVLDQWPVAAAHDGDHGLDGRFSARFTTVGSWRGGYGRVQWRGRLYGQKAHEFRRYAEVPRHSAAVFEVALDIHPAEAADLKLLRDAGWQLVDPRGVSGDPDAFRAYIQQSAAEFSPAQGIYVDTASGWFSDRTTRYLASGRPAVVQDTALPAEIPVGEGLLTFGDVDGAAAAVAKVMADYTRHSRAAREIAEACFDSDRVLAHVLEEALP